MCCSNKILQWSWPISTSVNGGIWRVAVAYFGRNISRHYVQGSTHSINSTGNLQVSLFWYQLWFWSEYCVKKCLKYFIIIHKPSLIWIADARLVTLYGAVVLHQQTSVVYNSFQWLCSLTAVFYKLYRVRETDICWYESALNDCFKGVLLSPLWQPLWSACCCLMRRDESHFLSASGIYSALLSVDTEAVMLC